MAAEGPAAGHPTRVALDGCCFVGNPTGIANYVGALLEGMCRAHPDVTFYSMSNEVTRKLDFGNLVARVSTPRRRGPVWQNTQLVEMIRDDEIDVFWGTNGLVPLRNLGRTGTVVTVHDLVHRFAPATQLPMIRWKQRVFQPLCVRSANRLVAVSQATADDAARHYRRSADAVIHPLAGPAFRHVDPVAADATLRDLGLPRRFLLSVGTLEPRKNVGSLIEAHWECLNAGIDLPALVIAGSEGWFNSRLQRLIDKATEQGVLRYLGYLANAQLAHLYARCTVFVMPSIYEGFGMPILEAQSCGASVVHGAHASMREAAGGFGVSADVTVAGLRKVLENFARGELPLACRRPEAIDNDQGAASARMWDVIVDAWRAAGKGMLDPETESP